MEDTSQVRKHIKKNPTPQMSNKAEISNSIHISVGSDISRQLVAYSNIYWAKKIAR